MPALGQADPQKIAPGAADIAHLHAAGFSDAQIAKYQQDTTQKLLSAGFTPQQVDQHWGTPEPHSPEVASHVAGNIGRTMLEVGSAILNPFKTMQDAQAAFEAGWGTSVLGIGQHIVQGKDPNKAFQTKPDPGIVNSIANASGQIVGDLPTEVTGFFAGAAAGAAIPGLGETGASEVAGAVGGAAGMGIASQGTREVLLDAYNRNQIHSVSDFLHIVGASTIRTLKAGVANAPFGLAGPIGGKLVEAGAKPVAAAIGGTAAATALGVSTGAAINGKMPDAGDFVTAAATMLLLHGGYKTGAIVKGVFKPSPATLHAASNLQEIYRRNGTTPWEAIQQAKDDPGLRQEILQQDVNGNSVAPRTHTMAPQEPQPLKLGQEGPEKSPSGRPMKNVTPKVTLNTSEDGKSVSAQFHDPETGGILGTAMLKSADGKTVKVENIIGVGGANTFGPKAIRQLIPFVKEAFPNVETINGTRISGAGTKGRSAEVSIQPPKPAPIVTSFEELSTALEGSRDDSVSPAGAIGKHQIMIGTARQYGFGEGMSQSELAQWLHNPENNARVFHTIAADLHARFHGDMNAMLIAYNAGPRRAGEYLTKGPGTMLEAIPDKSARGGIRYESVPSSRDESFLPMETQKYLANGRRRSGGATEGEGGQLARLEVFPSEKNHAEEGEGGGGGGGGEPPRIEGPEGEDGGRRRYTADEATDEIMANIGEPPKPPSLLNPDRLMEQYVSELSPARNIDTALVREGGFNRNRDVGQEDMFRQTYASDTRTGAFVRFGVLRIEDNAIRIVPDSPSILKATEEVKEAGGNMRSWTAYMLAKRTLDKNKQGIKTGFNLDASEDLATNGAEKARYEKATETFNKVMNGGLEYGRDSGLFSQSQIEAMMRDNPAYISMRRVMGDNESFGGKGGKFQSRDPLKLMEGSDRQIIDPIYSTIDNLRVIVAMADRNRAIGSIIGQVEQGKLPDLGLKQIEYNPKFTVSAKEGDPFKPYGLDADSSPQETYQSLLAERSAKGLGPNQFIFYRDGKAEVWEAKDPALVRLMKTAVGRGEANLIGKAFDKIASLDRMGIVTDPSFPTRIVLRHQITAFIADPMHPPPFLTLLRGVHDVVTESDVYKDWLANGGAGSALVDMDINWLQRDMNNVFEEEGIWKRMWNRPQTALEAYQWVSERMWAAAQVGYYKQGLESGLSPLKAATMSRKAFLDMAEKASLPAVNSVARKVPFLRPRILGIKQFAEAFASTNLKGKVGLSAAATFGLAVSTITIPTMVLYAANYLADKDLPDEEKFSSIPRYIRDTHYITPPIAGARIQFPFPFVVGNVFGGLTNRFLDYWAKSDPHAFDEWARSILVDYDPFSLMPTALRVPVESVSNYNFFTGHPIVPSSVEAADGYMQYTNATTEPAKAISRWLGKPGLNVADFSPIQLEHWVDGWTGPVGMGVLRAVNGRMTDYQPPHQMADIPVVGTFFVRNPDMHAQQIEDFYTDLKAMEAAHEDWALALKHGNEGEIATAARGPFYGLRMVGKIAAALHVQAAAVSAVNSDKTLRPEEKSQAVDQILNSMIQLSVMGSGITAELQGRQPSEDFRKLDRDGAMATAVGTANEQAS